MHKSALSKIMPVSGQTDGHLHYKKVHFLMIIKFYRKFKATHICFIHLILI